MTAHPSFPASGLSALPPVHPGAVLRDTVLPAIGKTASEAAQLMAVDPAELLDVLNGGRVSADMALRLGKLCGNGPDLWLNMQSAHDLQQARGVIGHELDDIPTLNNRAA